MADIDSILAGIGGNTRADFSGIGDLPKAYWEGKDQRAKNDLRDAFKPTAENPNGVPMKDGQIDIPTIAKTLFQKGDVAGGTALLGQAASAQDRSDYYKSLGPAAPPNYGPPATGRNAVAPDPSIRAPVSAAPAGTASRSSPQGDQPGSIVGMISAAGIPDELAGPYIAQISAMTKTDPNAALDPQTSSRVQQVVQAAAQRMKGGQQPQPSGLAPQPQMAQAPQAAPQGFQPSPAQVAAQNDPELKRARYFQVSQDKAIAEANRAEVKAKLEAQQPTNPMKEAGASGLTLQQYQERQGEQAAQQAGATERAKNDVLEQKTYIDNGRVAQQRLGTLNTLSNIISTDKNLNLGFGSETTLKVKMALEKAGFDVGDLSGAQMIQKMNGILASESTKSLATRPTQFEFKTFLGNNPGLALDEKGNIRMLGILSQNAKREVDLGKLARKNQDNWDNWDNVVEAYDKRNPVKDPTTGKILSSNSIIAPGPSKAAPQASGSAQAAPSAFPNAKQAPDGNWYVPDPARPGKYSKVVQ